MDEIRGSGQILTSLASIDTTAYAFKGSVKKGWAITNMRYVASCKRIIALQVSFGSIYVEFNKNKLYIELFKKISGRFLISFSVFRRNGHIFLNIKPFPCDFFLPCLYLVCVNKKAPTSMCTCYILCNTRQS